MAEVTMSLEEYNSLLMGAYSGTSNPPATPSPQKKRRKSTKRDKALSRALKSVNKRARRKDNTLRKGWTQSKIMKEAHRMVK